MMKDGWHGVIHLSRSVRDSAILELFSLEQICRPILERYCRPLIQWNLWTYWQNHGGISFHWLMVHRDLILSLSILEYGVILKFDAPTETQVSNQAQPQIKVIWRYFYDFRLSKRKRTSNLCVNFLLKTTDNICAFSGQTIKVTPYNQIRFISTQELCQWLIGLGV